MLLLQPNNTLNIVSPFHLKAQCKPYEWLLHCQCISSCFSLMSDMSTSFTLPHITWQIYLFGLEITEFIHVPSHYEYTDKVDLYSNAKINLQLLSWWDRYITTSRKEEILFGKNASPVFIQSKACDQKSQIWHEISRNGIFAGKCKSFSLLLIS